MVRCRECGADNPEGYKFCGVCEKELIKVKKPKAIKRTSEEQLPVFQKARQQPPVQQYQSQPPYPQRSKQPLPISI